MRNKTAEQLADEWYEKTKYLSDFPKDKLSFIAGYTMAIEKVKEYLFNTEEHDDIDSPVYISPWYLEQTIKFLK